MSKRAEEAALIAYPEVIQSNYPDTVDGYEHYLDDDCSNALCRECYQQGYKQAEKDLALTWEDVAKIITIYEAGIDNGDYRRYNEAEWMKEYSQDILRKFNEQRNMI